MQKLIDSQEKLPEEVLDKQIEKLVIRKEADRRSIVIPPSDIDAKINELLSIQRDDLNKATATPTPTPSPRPSATEAPEGFVPSSTPTITPTLDPQTPTPTPTPSPTLDPLTPTVTRTPFPTRPTATAIATATIPPTMTGDEFNKAYSDIKPLLKSESNYRDTIAYLLERERLRKSVGAAAPESGPRAHVLRLATSTKDEARVALIQLDQDFPFEELSAQASERPAEGRVSGDLGYVAWGSEAPEFDDVVFNPDTPLDKWIEPFPVGVHWETVRILDRDTGPYDGKNIEKIKDRMFKEWLDQAKQAPDIERDLSPQERQWAVDRASKGIFETTTDRRPGPSRRTP
ncbi:MAG: Peptidylprolyl isomerase [Chloroflexi bacterium]|nr:Peptidylprolyl isomerase [Chloroflexota bacterium]